MSKTVQSYFKSENDAESAHAKLNKLNISNVKVDKFPEDSDQLLLNPIAVLPGGSGFPDQTASPIANVPDEQLVDGSDDTGSRPYLLEFDVDDKDYREALLLLAESDGYIEKSQ